MAKNSYNFTPTKGLYINNNSVLEVPEGVCEVCSNVLLSREGIHQKRRGFTRVHTGLTDITSILPYESNLFAIDDGALYKCVNGVPTTEYTGVTFSANVQSAEASGNLYLADSGEQVYKLDGLTGTLKNAGVPKALDLSISETYIAGSIHEPNTQVAYRVLFGYRDENNNKLLSAPSALVSITNPVTTASASESTGTVTVTSTSHGLATGTIVKIVGAVDATNIDVTNINGEYTITNTGANTFTFTVLATPVGTLASLEFGVYKKPTLTASIPTGVEAGYFYQVYRSSQSTDEAVSPLEDLQLVDEVEITATDITNKVVTYADEIPDSFRGAFCYTNPSQEGITGANNPPPACTDMAYFRSCLFYSNVKELANKQITMVSVSDISNGDTLTISVGVDDYTYTAGAAESGTTFFLQTGSSVSINIDTTARSLASVINKDATSPVQAYYISGVNDAPGQIFLEATNYSVDSFSITVNAADIGGNFSPVLPTTGTSYSGIQQDRTNRVFFSKILEPEAVPSVNYLDLGDKSNVILRILPLRDSIIALTTKGVYRIGGTTPSDFYYRIIDSSVECVASRTATVLNDNAFFLARQGVCAANENAVAVISENINAYLFNIIQSGFVTNSRAVAYPSEDLYKLCCVKENPENSADKIVFAYDSVSGTWVSEDVVFEDSIIFNDRQYLVSQDLLSIYEERKDRQTTDFADSDNYTCEILSVDDTYTVTVESVDIALVAGMALSNVTELQIIESVIDLGSNQYQCVFNGAVESVVTDTYRVDTPITANVRTSPITLGDISNNKVFIETQLNFRNARGCSEISMLFINDNVSSDTIVLQTLARSQQSKEGWGSGEWGLFGWGDPEVVERDYISNPAECFRTYIPRECVRSKWLQIELTHSRIEPLDLQAISVLYTGSSGKKREN